MITGVTQERVLGPLPFIFRVLKHLKIIRENNMFSYADEAVVMISIAA